MPDSAQNKTEKPTPRRREKAREEGQVAQSQEVNNVLVMGAALAALLMFGSGIWDFMLNATAFHLGHLDGPELTPTGVESLATETLTEMGLVLAPFFALIVLAGLLAGFGQTGMLFSARAMSPKLSNMSPLKGIKKLVGLSALVQFLVSVLKLTAVAVIIVMLVRARLEWFYGLMGLSASGAVRVAREFFLILILAVIVSMLVIAVMDYCYQRWKHGKDLMMSKQEVREERKQSEGDPEVRARQARERRRMSKSRMAHAVAEASVVVTNPTHYAVALKWDEADMEAPVVVAKGKGLFALRLKKIAGENDVPVLERKLLSRTLYESVEVDSEIPPGLYRAVAEVLAFIMRKRN